MNYWRSKLSTFVIALSILTVCTLVPTFAQEEPRGKKMANEKDDDKRCNPNSSPLLAPGDVPGYHLSKYDSEPARGRIIEIWDKPAPDGSNRMGEIAITVMPLKSSSAAFAMAERLFYATTDKHQRKMLAKPTPGSFSGQPVGDYCWAYTVGITKPKPPRTCGTLIVVQGNYLFRLQVAGGLELVDTLFVEKTAQALAKRLKRGPRPPGFDDGNHGHGNDDDHHDDDNPGNGHH